MPVQPLLLVSAFRGTSFTAPRPTIVPGGLMKRFVISILAAAAAMPLVAQQPSAAGNTAAKAEAPPQKIVANINGESITAEKLDQLYSLLSAKGRDQYNKNGGKSAFLDNYVGKRLLVQEAIKRGFDKRADVQADMDASKESTLFDRYVRDVVAEQIVSNEQVQKFYDEHPDEFKTPEQVHARHILIMVGGGPHPKDETQAREMIEKIAAELHGQNVFPPGIQPETATRLVMAHFADAAEKYSEDGTAQLGGDLGWQGRGVFDKDFEDAAFTVRKGTVSGIIKTKFGFHLIAIEDKKAAGMESFEDAKPTIREYLMTQHAAEVVGAVKQLTNELRATSKITVYTENIK
jgi:peptidyl-prolyl cis-trans isomerase C